MSWTPIATGDERDAIQRLLVEIVTDLRRSPLPAGGDALGDRAVLHGYLAADGTLADDRGTGDEALARFVEHLTGGELGPSLFGGAARVAWTIAHLADGADAAIACAAIDTSLLRRLESWDGDYDLISGLVGFAVYALERGEAGHELARRVLAQLERRARPRAGGLAWHTPGEQLVAHERDRAPEGYWNLGVAHGIPGVIALLARYVAAGIEPARSRALLDAAMTHLRAIEPARDGYGRYPPWQPTSDPVSPRLAWCYGDLGVASAMLGAGLLVGDTRWQREGIALARACAGRSVRAASIVDAGVCHGAAGIAHLFNRMAQATGDEVLAAAARGWLAHTLALCRTHPVAGFPPLAASADPALADPDRPRVTLLTGAPGVALVLHAAISEVEPAWDRLLLADLPPR